MFERFSHERGDGRLAFGGQTLDALEQPAWQAERDVEPLGHQPEISNADENVTVDGFGYQATSSSAHKICSLPFSASTGDERVTSFWIDSISTGERRLCAS